MVVRTVVPADNDELRREVYDGGIYLLRATAESEALVCDAWDVIEAELGEPRIAHQRFDPADLFERIGRVRRVLFLDAYYHEAVWRVAASLGFDPERIAFDPIRLRVVAHRGHENERAKAVYYPHRDTWYAHSQSVITWWIPLHDTPPAETFVFYPERFREPVPNGSARFHYGQWVEDGWGLKIGWQDRDAGLTADYPGVIGDVDGGREVGFACRRADNLLFAGAHFHRTLPQESGRTRYSLDFRIVHLDDHEVGRGAPNVDNRSRGSAVVDYVRPVAR